MMNLNHSNGNVLMLLIVLGSLDPWILIWIYLLWSCLFWVCWGKSSHQMNGSLTYSSNVSKLQSSTFNSRFNDRKNHNSNPNRGRNQNLQRKNCGLKVHLIEKCYMLIAYPRDFIPRSEYDNSNRQSNQNKSFSINPSFSF